MRAGSCALQQALTADAAGIVKQAVALARRRGHAQVTPLHVASTMLSATSGLFRVACLQSHSHPLQCKALELCFNVALNRLPASSSSPMLGNHSQYPSISNALVAAFKRAQAHQRRGSAENQQQPLLAAKIELEQLIVSILDDPSVSRVMREAGFSSTQVKTNVEKAVSSEFPSPPKTKPIDQSESNKNDDVGIIIQNLLKRKRKNLVIVGESISNMESTVKEVMERVDKGNVPEVLRDVKFVSIPPLYSFCNLQREIVEKKMGELSYLVKSLVRNGVVLYLGDLNWISEYRVNLEHERSCYCSVEYVIMELGRLVYEINGDDDQIGRFWLMGIATLQTYMRCRTGKRSLETVWGLNPVTVPANTLGLSLISQSESNNEANFRRDETGSSEILTNGEVKLSCCADCSSKFEAEARNMIKSSSSNSNEPTLSNLPPWMIKDRRSHCNNDQNFDSKKELCEKWNSYCSSAHKKLTLSSSSTSCFSFDQTNPNPQETHFPLPISLWKDPKHALSSTMGSDPNSPSSSDVMDTGYTQKLKEFNAHNLNTLCEALEKNVPWQREIIPEIAGTILQCRSRMLKRKEKNDITDHHIKEETWLLFLGHDVQAKQKISKELAKVVFGSYSNFVPIGISSTRWDLSLDDHRNERVRDHEESCNGYIERFAQAVSENPHCVFFIEDLEEADYCSKMVIKRAIERGRISIVGSGDEVSFCDAIFVLSCERSLGSESSVSCTPSSRNPNCISLDLNMSFDIDDVENDQSIDNLGILENVDRSVNFKLCQEL